LPSGDDFYQENPPGYLMQGDILTGVPLLMLPPSKELVLVRSHPSRLNISLLQGERVEAVRELAANNPFDNRPEYVIVSAVRALAILMTATCDLVEDGADTWVVCPVNAVEGSGYDTGNLKAGKYSNLFWLPAYDHFPDAFVDLSDLRQITRESIDLDNRLASLIPEKQNALADKFVLAMGRSWGYEEGDLVPPIQKYETGKYNCLNCNKYDIEYRVYSLASGSKFPECPNCKKIGKAAQWHPLFKHRKS
jgi:hypothetical protein